MDTDSDAQARPQRPRWTLSEAAKRAGTSRATLLRRIDAGQIPGAIKAENGWSIGVDDLLAAGFRLDRPAPHEGTTTDAHGHGAAAQRIAELEADLAVERARRTAAEQVAVERERTIEVQAAHLRMLTAGTGSTPQQAAEPAPQVVAAVEITPPGGVVGWFRRAVLG